MIKENIRTRIIDWIAENELFNDAFAHTAGKNQELALIGDKVIDLILFKKLYQKERRLKVLDMAFTVKSFSKGAMDLKRQEYFSRTNQAKIFEKLELEEFLIDQHQSPSENVKHTTFEAIFGALYILKGMDSTVELLKSISHFMGYNLFD